MILINSGANASCKRVWNIQSGKSRVCSRRYKNVHAVCWARWHMKWKLTAASSAKLSHPPGDPILDTSGKLPFEQQWNPQYYWNIEFQSGFDLEQVSFPLSPSLFTSTVESFTSLDPITWKIYSFASSAMQWGGGKLEFSISLSCTITITAALRKHEMCHDESDHTRWEYFSGWLLAQRR